MTELLFVACLATVHPTCLEKSLVYTDIPVRQCIELAQPALARWIGVHPNWTIARWTCRPAGAEQEI
jgi:hypothetical protein